jgi:general secretion pathway protein K
LLTFFAAAKKVSAAPHRGNTNRPLRKQGKANTIEKTAKTKAPQAKRTASKAKKPALI